MDEVFQERIGRAFLKWFAVSIILVIGLVGVFIFGWIRGSHSAGARPEVYGGYSKSPDGAFAAGSHAIVERPLLGPVRQYYRFVLVRGEPGGSVLRSVTMMPLDGEEFRTPRGGPVFPVRWREDSRAATFVAPGGEITLSASDDP